MPQLHPEQIAYLIGTNCEPHVHDGVSNAERVACIVNVFGRSMLPLDEEFDYGVVMQSDDPVKVQAAIYLATLQHQYLAVMMADGHTPVAIGDPKQAVVHLWALKMQWHLKHLKENKFTPPFPFVN